MEGETSLRIGSASLACLVIAVMTTAFPAWAGGREPYVPIDAQKLIKDCWAISKVKRDSGVTGKMRYGTAETVGCLQNVIREQAKIIFDQEYLEELNLDERLNELADAIQKIYWKINNEHRGCDPSCGTMYQLFHLTTHADILEKIIHDMVKKRNDYKIGPRGINPN